MIYYYGGKFNPWTKGHSKVIECLLSSTSENGFQVCSNPDDKIVIGFTNVSANLETNNYENRYENRMELAMIAIDKIAKKFPVIANNVIFVSQTNPSTYEFLDMWCMMNNVQDWENNVVLVLGEDEYSNLKQSPNSTTPKWKHSEELLKFKSFVVPRSTSDISSTKVKNILFKNPYTCYYEVQDLLDKSVFEEIKNVGAYWQEGYEEDYRRQENLVLRKYDIEKFPRPSATVDVIAIKTSEVASYEGKDVPIENVSEKVLLIRRKNYPYKGFWALPGGFLDIESDETLEDAANREFREEVGLNLNISKSNQFRTYSDMGTDPRGRIVDTVYVVKNNCWQEPKAGDDAGEFFWFDIENLPRMAFNHRQIIEDFLRK